MIYDKIDNITLYSKLSEDIRIGLLYLRDLNFDIENGVYELSSRVKAIVSEYITKEVNNNGYEAHRDFIDIQYLLVGKEIICYSPLEYLKEIKPYNPKIDAAFFVGTGEMTQEIQLGNGYFAIFFPEDGHMPCLNVKRPESVKKVVIKVKL